MDFNLYDQMIGFFPSIGHDSIRPWLWFRWYCKSSWQQKELWADLNANCYFVMVPLWNLFFKFKTKQMNITIIHNKLVIFPCREIKTKTYPNNFSEEGECTNWFRPFQRIVKNTNLFKMKMLIAKIKNKLCF